MGANFELFCLGVTDSRAAPTGHNINIHTENYLKTIWNLSRLNADPKKLVLNSQIAEWLHVKRPSVSEMLFRLSAAGLVELVPRKGVRLSAKGEKIALGLLRRHRLVEFFLQETLKITSLEAHKEAEVLEHAVTPELCAHMEKYLGYPSYDQQGMPIPNQLSKVSDAKKNEIKAAQLAPGQWAKVSACPDYDESAHRKVLEKGISVGLLLQRLESPGAILYFKSKKGISYHLSHQEAELVQMKVHSPQRRG